MNAADRTATQLDLSIWAVERVFCLQPIQKANSHAEKAY